MEYRRIVFVIFLLLQGCQMKSATSTAPQVAASPTPAGGGGLVFSALKAQVLTPYCVSCHTANGAGGFDITIYTNLVPSYVKPQDSKHSPLYSDVTATSTNSANFMPQNGARLSDANIQLISDWIDQGAKFDAPTLTGATPSSGPPGTTLVLAGTNILPTAKITVGGNDCPVSSTPAPTSTSISCTTPSGATGKQDVVLTNPEGSKVTLTAAFTVTAATAVVNPTITSVIPNIVIDNATTKITITGTGFSNSATVAIGAAACTGVSATATSITCTAAAAADGVQALVVTNPDKGNAQFAKFTYVAPASVPSYANLTNKASANGIFANSCASCHAQKGSTAMKMWDCTTLATAASAAAVQVAGKLDPTNALIVKILAAKVGAVPQMPENAKPLTAAQQQFIQSWIANGAL